MNSNRFLWIVVALFWVSGTASASLVLSLDDPSTSEIELRIVDQDENDTSPQPGIVGVAPGTTIGGVEVRYGRGFSKPGDGNVTSPLLIMANESISTGVGRMIYAVTDTDYKANRPYHAFLGGGTAGTLQLDFFGDSNNQEYGWSFDIGSTDVLTGTFDPHDPRFHFQSSANPVGSLTMAADIRFSGIDQIGEFQSEISAVPLPPALALLATALAGLGILRWRPRFAA